MLLKRNLESVKRVVSDTVGLYAKLIVVIVKVTLGHSEYANLTDKFSPWVNVKNSIPPPRLKAVSAI